MGMDTRVTAFRPADAKWKQMKAIWDSCEAAGIEIPEEVDEFFDGEPPDPSGIEVDISSIAEDWGNEDAYGFQISVAKIPKGVTHIRFYNSW